MMPNKDRSTQFVPKTLQSQMSCIIEGLIKNKHPISNTLVPFLIGINSLPLKNLIQKLIQRDYKNLSANQLTGYTEKYPPLIHTLIERGKSNAVFHSLFKLSKEQQQNCIDAQGNTIFHVAAKCGHSGILDKLINTFSQSLDSTQDVASLSDKNNEGKTPLMIAIFFNQSACLDI